MRKNKLKVVKTNGKITMLYKGKGNWSPFMNVSNYNKKTRQYDWAYGYHHDFKGADNQFQELVTKEMRGELYE